MSNDLNSNRETGEDTQEVRESFASAFDRSADPLAEYSSVFDDLPDPFEYYVETALQNREAITCEVTIENYCRDYEQWHAHMESTGRHPACPNPEHVRSFIESQREDHDNTKRTILEKLSHLSQAYRFWQEDAAFPHPADYNPFSLGRKMTDLGPDSVKDVHDLSLCDLQEVFADVENIRRRAAIGLQLKLGLRAGGVCNIKLQDFHITHREVQDHYTELGSHDALGEYSDVIYVPHDRDGTKSSNPRLLPIDEELRWLLFRHLLIRPQVEEPWLFLSDKTYSQLTPSTVNRFWQDEFHPEYAETEEKRAVSSHYGRHWFTSYWRLTAGMDREHIQYMRGDRVEPLDNFPDTIDDYLHPNYDHIEQEYREKVFTLDVPMRHH